MSILSLGYSFIALLVMLTTVLLRGLPLGRSTTTVRLVLALALALAVLFSPLPDGPGYYYLRAYFGDLSLTSVLFFVALSVRRLNGKALHTPSEEQILLSAVVVLGLCLYPMALGLGPFDPYALGYQPRGLLIAFLLVALYCWLQGHIFLLLLILSATAAFWLQILESTNLWDYLIDPVIWIFATVWLLVTVVRKLRRQWQRL